MKDGRNDMHTLTPPNEPLTLEQLREMKDELAYLKVFDPLLKSGWQVIKDVTKDKIIFKDWQTVYVPIDGMGVDYNLYRRPPEGRGGQMKGCKNCPAYAKCTVTYLGSACVALRGTYGLDNNPEIITNADRIRDMSDHDLEHAMIYYKFG